MYRMYLGTTRRCRDLSWLRRSTNALKIDCVRLALELLDNKESCNTDRAFRKIATNVKGANKHVVSTNHCQQSVWRLMNKRELTR